MAISGEIREIPLSEIEISPSNVRKDRDVAIRELANNIEELGLLQPILLVGKYGEPPYKLVIGQRRYKAYELLSKEGKSEFGTIKAIFEEDDLDETQEQILSLVENMERIELNYADKAEAITALYLQFDKSVKTVAKKTGIPESTIRDYIKLEEIASPIAKGLLRKKKINKVDVRRAYDAAQGDIEKADEILKEMVALDYYAKSNIVEVSSENPEYTPNEIITKAKEPKVTKTITIDMTIEISKALDKATEELSESREAIAELALEKWLIDNNFLS